MHREVTGAPTDMHVDHVNGDRLDNRACNLRVILPQHNVRNRTAYGRKCEFKGVSGGPDRWIMQVGGFESAEAAAIARDRIARELFGDEGTYNFPRSGERSAITGKIEP